MAALVGVVLNATLAEEAPETGSEETERHEWNEPGVLVGERKV
jgi:hypothetical protein